MNPYSGLPAHHFWSAQPEYDPNPKWLFDLSRDTFATAGSCFAQHIARAIRSRAGRYVETETPPPYSSGGENGYGLYSARTGNIYTCRQLRQVLEQAFGLAGVVRDFHRRADGRWIDLSRLRAVPQGFTSERDCEFDRRYHLERVGEIFRQASVFIFTLGLTEAWVNKRTGVCYPICPAVAGAYNPADHAFQNFSFAECLADLRRCLELITTANAATKILLTVSPVMLVATFEPRGALQSSVASKSILRAVADCCVREFENVDYFPSYEIVTGPQAAGRFFKDDKRDVTPEGVAHVMDAFFASRIHGAAPMSSAKPATTTRQVEGPDDGDPECDEILLGRRP